MTETDELPPPLTRASEAPADREADAFWRTLHGYYLTTSGDVGLCMAHTECDEVVLVLDDMERIDTEVAVLAALMESHEYHRHGRNVRFSQPPF